MLLDQIHSNLVKRGVFCFENKSLSQKYFKNIATFQKLGQFWSYCLCFFSKKWKMMISIIILHFNLNFWGADYIGSNCEPHEDLEYNGCSIETDVLTECLLTTGLVCR